MRNGPNERSKNKDIGGFDELSWERGGRWRGRILGFGWGGIQVYLSEENESTKRVQNLDNGGKGVKKLPQRGGGLRSERFSGGGGGIKGGDASDDRERGRRKTVSEKDGKINPNGQVI